MENNDRIVRDSKGREYKIVCEAEHTENGKKYTVYMALYHPYKFFISSDSIDKVDLDDINIGKYDPEDRRFKAFDVVRHFKGNYYMVICDGIDISTGEHVVVYAQLYEPYKIWVRPAEMFYSKVDKNKYPDVEQEYRFERVVG